MSIPDSYQQATWRNTLPKDEDTQQVGIDFDLPEGGVIRLSLSVGCAKHLAERLCFYLAIDQSAIASGIPSSDVSISPKNRQLCPFRFGESLDNYQAFKAKGLLLQAHELLFKVERLSSPSSREHLLATSILTFLGTEQNACLHKTCCEPGQEANDVL